MDPDPQLSGNHGLLATGVNDETAGYFAQRFLAGRAVNHTRLPAMIQIMRMDPRVAAGTNLAISTITGLFGFLGHLLHLEVDWPVLVILGSTAMLGSYLGAKQTGKVSPQTLTRSMGAVMVASSLPIFWLAYTQL